MRTSLGARREDSLKASGKHFTNIIRNAKGASVNIRCTAKAKTCLFVRQLPEPLSDLANHLECEGIFVGDLFESLETPRRAGMAGSHVDLEQDRIAAG